MIGQRIFYHGDMANEEGLGTVTKVDDSRFGWQVRLTMDDGREFWIAPHMIHDHYEGHGGTRFCTEAAYRAWREEQIERLKRTYAEIQARKS